MNIQTEEPQVEAMIRQFIAKNILLSGTEFPYSNDASLLKEGIIDSMGVVELVELVQESFGVKVGQSEVTPENFETVARLAAFVRRKTAGSLSAC